MKIVSIDVSTGFISGRDKIAKRSESNSVSVDGTIPSGIETIEDARLFSQANRIAGIKDSVMDPSANDFTILADPTAKLNALFAALAAHDAGYYNFVDKMSSCC